ncbi:MAG: hypothetical protein ACRD21_21700 [Vicinamibacteria bacterium]
MSWPDPDLERLRESYLASLRDRAADSDPPPDADRIWDAVSGVLPPEERRQVVDRVATDAAWAEAWRLAHEIWSSTEEAGSSGFWQSYRYLAAAASVAILLGAGILIREILAPEPIYRDPGGARIESLVPEEQRLPQESMVLRWTDVAPQARYEVTVTTESLEVVASARDLEDPEYHVPPQSLSDLPPGARLFWQVTARLEDGTEQRSQTFAVTVE